MEDKDEEATHLDSEDINTVPQSPEKAPAVRKRVSRARVTMAVVGVGFLVAVMIAVVYYNEITKFAFLDNCDSSICKDALKSAVGMRSTDDAHGPCLDFYAYSCAGWERMQAPGATYLSELTSKLLDRINASMNERTPGDEAKDPYRNLIIFHKSCNLFHSTPTPLNRLVQKAVGLIDFSFGEWLGNDNPLSFFFFVIRLSFNRGIDTLFHVHLAKENSAGPVVIVSVGQAIATKMRCDEALFDVSQWRLYMKDVIQALETVVVPDDVVRDVFEWDDVLEKLADHGGRELIKIEDLPTVKDYLDSKDWLSAINYNLEDALRLPSVSTRVIVEPNLSALQSQTNRFFETNNKKKLLLLVYTVLQGTAGLLKFDFLRNLAPCRTCLARSYEHFRVPMLGFIANAVIREAAYKDFEKHFQSLREKLIKHIGRVHWMDHETKLKARTLTGSVKLDFLRSAVREVNREAPGMGKDYFWNIIKILEYTKQQRTRYPTVERKEVSLYGLLHGVLHYKSVENVLHVPPIMMLPPVYFRDPKNPFLDCATVGALLVSEMYKSVQLLVSTAGSGERAKQDYEQYRTCFQDQYDRYLADRGENTTSVPTAVRDAVPVYTSGVQLSYSFGALVKLRSKELFFTRYCQMFCRSAEGIADPDDHESGHALCNLPLMNNADFRKTFKCGPNTAMAKERVCSIA